MEHSDKPLVRPSGTPTKFDVNADKTLVQRGLLAAQSLGVVQSARYFYERGLAKYAEGTYQEAVEHFRRAVSLSPFFPEAYFHLGLALRSLGGAVAKRSFGSGFKFVQWSGPNIDQAIAAFRTAVAQRDEYPEAHLQIGLTLWPFGEDEDSKTARSEIKRAVSLRPTHCPEGHLILGLMLAEEENWKEMESEFKLVLSQDPTLHWLEDNVYMPCVLTVYPLQWCRGYLFHEIEEYEKAVAEFSACLSILLQTEAGNEEPIIDCCAELGDVYQAMKNYPTAISYYQTAIGVAAAFGKDSLAPSLREKLGSAYFSCGSFQDAIREFRLAIGGGVDRKLTHLTLGLALQEAGRHREAVEEFSIGLLPVQQETDVVGKQLFHSMVRPYIITLKDVPRLIAYGKRRGYLRREEIKNLVPELANSAALLDALVYILIVDEGVDIISDEKQK